VNDGPPIYCPECEEPNTRDSARCCVCQHPLRAIVQVHVTPRPLSLPPVSFGLSKKAKIVIGLGLLGLIPLSIYSRPKPVDGRRVILEKCIRETLLGQGQLLRDSEIVELIDVSEKLIDRGRDARVVCVALSVFPQTRDYPIEDLDRFIVEWARLLNVVRKFQPASENQIPVVRE